MGRRARRAQLGGYRLPPGSRARSEPEEPEVSSRHRSLETTSGQRRQPHRSTSSCGPSRDLSNAQSVELARISWHAGPLSTSILCSRSRRDRRPGLGESLLDSGKLSSHGSELSKLLQTMDLIEWFDGRLQRRHCLTESPPFLLETLGTASLEEQSHGTTHKSSRRTRPSTSRKPLGKGQLALKSSSRSSSGSTSRGRAT